jgi:ABC-2 type transport system permease protein
VSASRILAVARRIISGFRRDHRTLGLVFVVPIVITALLGWVLTDQRSTTVGVWIVNEAGAPGERIVDALVEATTGAPDGVEVIGTAETREAARKALQQANGELAIVLPASLLDDVLAGARPTITVISLGTDPGAEAGAFQRFQSIVEDLAGSIVPPGGQAPVIPEIERETVYLSPDATSVDVLAPVFLGYFGYFFVFILTGISFLRERMGGTLERLLATPVTRAEIVLGYSLGFGLFATLQVLILTIFVLMSVEVPELGPIPAFTIGLGVDSAGPAWLAFGIALLLSLGAVNLGIFLSTFARNEFQILQFIPLVIIPQGLLGGIFWPIDKLPEILAPIARVLPMTYAVEGLREVMLKGADLSSGSVQLDLVLLAGIALFFVAVAAATIKREVA